MKKSLKKNKKASLYIVFVIVLSIFSIYNLFYLPFLKKIAWKKNPQFKKLIIYRKRNIYIIYIVKLDGNVDFLYTFQKHLFLRTVAVN